MTTFLPEHARGVVRCVREVYGSGYAREDLYDPDTLIARNRCGKWISAVALDPEGRVVGHAALERTPGAERVVELGMVLVIPEYRRRGLLSRMRSLLYREARRRGVVGLWVELSTTDLVAQKTVTGNALSHPCGITLHLWPAPGSGAGSEDPARRSYLFQFGFFGDPPAVRASVPDRHRALVDCVFQQFGVEVSHAARARRDSVAVSSPPQIAVRSDPRKGCAFMKVERVGRSTLSHIADAARDLEREGVVCMVLDLPLSDPRTPELCSRAEGMDFFFSGVAPCFLRDDSALRLQRIASTPDFDRIHVLTREARRLRAHVKAEFRRVVGPGDPR